MRVLLYSRLSIVRLRLNFYLRVKYLNNTRKAIITIKLYNIVVKSIIII